MHYIIVALFLIYCKSAVAPTTTPSPTEYGKLINGITCSQNSDCRSGSCKHVEKNVESKYGYRSKIPSSMRCAKCRVDADCNSQKQCLPREGKCEAFRPCNSNADCVDDSRRYCLAAQCQPTCYIYDHKDHTWSQTCPPKTRCQPILENGNKIRDSGYSGTDTRFIGRCTPASLDDRAGASIMQEIVVPFLPYEKVKNWNHNNNYYYSYDNNLARDISNWLSINTDHIIVHIVDSFVNSGGQANGIRIVYEYHLDHKDGIYRRAKENLLTGYLQSRNVNSLDTSSYFSNSKKTLRYYLLETKKYLENSQIVIENFDTPITWTKVFASPISTHVYDFRLCTDPSSFDADHISTFMCTKDNCNSGDCHCHERSCRTSAKICEIDKRLTAFVDQVCLNAISECNRKKVQGMCLSKKYAEARDKNGYFNHNNYELVECHEEKCKMDAAYCESLAGQIANNYGPEVYTYTNDLRYYSSTQLPESVRLDDAIHILEHYGECCELRKLQFANGCLFD